MRDNTSLPYRSVTTILLILTFTAAALGQQSAVERLERQLRIAERNYTLQPIEGLSLGERAMLDVGGILSFSFMAIDDIEQRTRILRQTDFVGYAFLDLDGAHQFYGQLHLNYRDFNEGDSFDGSGDSLAYPLADRYWYRFDLRRAYEISEGTTLPNNITVQVGRQFVEWASGLTLSDALYAARMEIEMGPPGFEVEALLGATPESSFIDFDSSRPSFDGDTNRMFVGGKLTWVAPRTHQPYVFILHQSDNNDEDFSNITFGTETYPTRFDYDSTYWGIGSTGQLPVPGLVYAAEFVWESGTSISNSFDNSLLPLGVLGREQTYDDIEAWAAIVTLSYYLGDDARTELEFETILASGDDDRFLDTSNTFGGNEPGSTDRAFNAFGFANTGLAFAAPVSNIMLYRLGGSTYPLRQSELFRRLRFDLDLFFFNKLDPDAPLDQPTTDHRWLGFETDISADWRVTSDVSIFVRYGVFFPGSGIDGDDDARHFFFSGVSYSF
jgi:hypothetical protein